jgi:hypothetical protein
LFYFREEGEEYIGKLKRKLYSKCGGCCKNAHLSFSVTLESLKLSVQNYWKPSFIGWCFLLWVFSPPDLERGMRYPGLCIITPSQQLSEILSLM